MRALTVMQPWAGAIAYGKKNVENRTWSAPDYIIGQTFAVHAGRSVDWDATAAAWIAAGLTPYDGIATRKAWSASLTLGAVVAVARVTASCLPWECRGECSPWAAKGQDHWQLADVRPLPEPVPCRGMLGLWRLPDEVERLVRAQI
jgi:hypothetical protein